MRSRSLHLAMVFVCLLGACSKAEQNDSREPASDRQSDASEPGDGDGVIGATSKELPPELVAELRLQGADADGRLLTLGPSFMATAACSDCGAPSYSWFLAVRCTDTRHCEVLTEQCEGRIGREEQTFVLEFRPVGGAPAEDCAGYSGMFEPAR